MYASVRARFARLILMAALLCGHAPLLQAQEEGPWPARWILINEPGSGPQLLRVSQLKVRESIVSVLTVDGDSMGWQRDFYVGEAPAIPEDLAGIAEADLVAAIEKQQALVDKAGGLAGPLSQELARLQFAVNAIHKAKEKTEREQLEARLAAWQETEYDPGAIYPLEQIDTMIQIGVKLVEEAPDLDRQVRERLQTMIDHRGHIAAGHRYWKGQWVDLGSIENSFAAQESARQKKFFEERFKVELPVEAFGGFPVLVVFAPSLITLLLILTFLFQVVSDNALPKGAVGVVTLVVLLGLTGYNFLFLNGVFYGKKTISDFGIQPAKKSAALAESALGRVLYVSSKPEMVVMRKTDEKVELLQEEINGALAGYLVYGGKGSESRFSMARQATAFVIDPRRLIVLDEIRFMGQSLLLQTHIMVEISEESIEFYDFEVHLGNTKLPGLMANHVWKQMQPQYQALLQNAGLGSCYGIHKIEPGKVIMLMTSPPEGAVDMGAELKRITQATNEAD